MASKTVIEQRIRYRTEALEKLYAAYTALAEGGVKSYTIDDRELTRYDLAAIGDEIRRLENEIDELGALLDGGSRRKAVAVVPRDI